MNVTISCWRDNVPAKLSGLLWRLLSHTEPSCPLFSPVFFLFRHLCAGEDDCSSRWWSSFSFCSCRTRVVQLVFSVPGHNCARNTVTLSRVFVQAMPVLSVFFRMTVFHKAKRRVRPRPPSATEPWKWTPKTTWLAWWCCWRPPPPLESLCTSILALWEILDTRASGWGPFMRLCMNHPAGFRKSETDLAQWDVRCVSVSFSPQLLLVVAMQHWIFADNSHHLGSRLTASSVSSSLIKHPSALVKRSVAANRFRFVDQFATGFRDAAPVRMWLKSWTCWFPKRWICDVSWRLKVAHCRAATDSAATVGRDNVWAINDIAPEWKTQISDNGARNCTTRDYWDCDEMTPCTFWWCIVVLQSCYSRVIWIALNTHSLQELCNCCSPVAQGWIKL